MVPFGILFAEPVEEVEFVSNIKYDPQKQLSVDEEGRIFMLGRIKGGEVNLGTELITNIKNEAGTLDSSYLTNGTDLCSGGVGTATKIKNDPTGSFEYALSGGTTTLSEVRNESTDRTTMFELLMKGTGIETRVVNDKTEHLQNLIVIGNGHSYTGLK